MPGPKNIRTEKRSGKVVLKRKRRVVEWEKKGLEEEDSSWKTVEVKRERAY